MINQFHFYTTRHNPHGYEGRNLNIVPLSFEHTEKLLEKFKHMYSKNKVITQDELKLFLKILLNMLLITLVIFGHKKYLKL